jgi:hypothetical protein
MQGPFGCLQDWRRLLLSFLSLLLFSFSCSNQQATNKTTALPAVFKLFCIWCKLTVYNPAAGGYLLATASLSLERAIP